MNDQEKTRSVVVNCEVPAVSSDRSGSATSAVSSSSAGSVACASPDECTVNLLPIGVHRGGEVNAKQFFRPFLAEKRPESDSRHAPPPDAATTPVGRDDKMMLVNFRGRLFSGSHIKLPSSCIGVVYDEIYQGEDERHWKRKKIGGPTSNSDTFSSFVAWQRAEDKAGSDASSLLPLRWLQFLQFSKEVQRPFSSEKEIDELLSTIETPTKAKKSPAKATGTPSKSPAKSKGTPSKSLAKGTPVKSPPAKRKSPGKTTPSKSRTPSKTESKRKLDEEASGSARKKSKA